MSEPITLVGDGIENPWNARTMLHAAEMFGARCAFRDRKGLADAWKQVQPLVRPLPLVSLDDLTRAYHPVIAFENLEGARDVYGHKAARGPRPALIVGNERRGLAQDMIVLATESVQVPLVSRTLSSLNVAAAAAVGLYYLCRGGGTAMQIRSDPERRRPELLLLDPADHWELGSMIRSAAAFGWRRVLVDDRTGVWFGAERVTRSEGRAAARRGRNPVRVVPAAAGRLGGFMDVWVVTARGGGVPLHRAPLAGGHRQLIVIPDESVVDLPAEDWEQLGTRVRFVRLELPRDAFPYHYRLIATIALAEVARQVGGRTRGILRPRPAGPSYDAGVRVLEQDQGETVYAEDLDAY